MAKNKSHFTVSVIKELSNDQIAGLLCTGFEGGMTGQWAEVVRRHKPSVLPEFAGDWNEYPLYSFPLAVDGSIEIRDIETDTIHKLDRESIVKGLKIMADKYPRHFNDFIDENDDAITGDVFVQCCVLGDCIYG